MENENKIKEEAKKLIDISEIQALMPEDKTDTTILCAGIGLAVSIAFKQNLLIFVLIGGAIGNIYSGKILNQVKKWQT